MLSNGVYRVAGQVPIVGIVVTLVPGQQVKIA